MEAPEIWRTTETGMAKRTVSNTPEDFNPRNLDVIRADIESALKTVAEQHGVTFALGNTDYTPGSFSVRLEAKRDGGDKRDFEQYAASYGLRASDFGATFMYRNAKYTISGINPGAGTYPIVTSREDGECIRFREDLVREALKAGRTNGN